MSSRDNLRDRPAIANQVKEEMRRLLLRSSTDAAFRRKLIEDPRAAVEEFTGRVVPKDFHLKFVDSQADATIVLPRFIASDGELSTTELDAAHGGSGTGAIVEVAAAHLLASLIAGVRGGLADA